MRKRGIRITIVIFFLFMCGFFWGDGFLSTPISPRPAAASEETQALAQAKLYIMYIAYSRQGLIDQLMYDGFPRPAAEYAADNCGADWNEMAVKMAGVYLGVVKFSRGDLIRQLETDGFTHDQAIIGANAFFDDEPEDDGPDLVDEKDTEGTPVQGEDSAEISTSTPTEIPTEMPAEATGDISDVMVSDAMIDVLIDNFDNLFPIRSLEDIFTPPMVATYSDVGPATAVQTSNQDGMRHLSLYANADSVHDHNVVIKINAGSLQNFLLSMDVRVNDVYPSGQGGCFIGYINESVKATQDEDVAMVGLLIDGKKVEFYTKEKEADSGDHFYIKDKPKDTYRLRLIRLTGQTFAFVDGLYVGQFHDGKNGPFQLLFGSALFGDGDSSECSFDNLVVRKVVK